MNYTVDTTDYSTVKFEKSTCAKKNVHESRRAKIIQVENDYYRV